MFEGIWWFAYVSLWVLVVLEGLLLMALARQVGLLHTRLGPTGARMGNAGLELGDLAPRFEQRALNGQVVALGIEQRKPTLMIFTSTRCPICTELNPSIRALYDHEKKELDVVLVSLVDDEAENRSYSERHHLNSIPLVISRKVVDAYQVAVTPYAILVSAEGRVIAKGMVNTLEHLESILNTLVEGYPSLDSKMNALTAVHRRAQGIQIGENTEGGNERGRPR